MRIIKRKGFIEAQKEYPRHKQAIEDTYRILKCLDCRSPSDLKKVFASLDNFKYVDKWWVIDISGNHLRLIGYINFNQPCFFFKHLVSHAEYDKLCKKFSKGKFH